MSQNPGDPIYPGYELPVSENAPLSNNQIDSLAKGERVYVDESLYYVYDDATDTLKLINEIDGSVVRQGTFDAVLQVNKTATTASSGAGIILALGAVLVALSMSKQNTN